MIESNVKDYGAKIKKVRESAGLTRYELEKSIQLSANQMTRIEFTSPPNIQLSTLLKITDALDISIDKLFGRKKAPTDCNQ